MKTKCKNVGQAQGQNQKSCVAQTRVSKEKLRQCEGLEHDSRFRAWTVFHSQWKGSTDFLTKGKDAVYARRQ